MLVNKQPSPLTLFIIFSLIAVVGSDSVCDEKTLKLELKQDIEDNGILDCLRTISKPHSYDESLEEYNKRIFAQWDTECAFEAEYDWIKDLREIHGISNLVDDSGDVVEKDFDDQADMCEIVRAAIAAGKFEKITMDLVNIPVKVFDYVDCVGDSKQTELCAVTGSSYFQKDTWLILLDGMAISVKDNPKFIKVPDQIEMPELPEDKKDDKKDDDKVEKADMTIAHSTDIKDCSKLFNTKSNMPLEGMDLKLSLQEESLLWTVGSFSGSFEKEDSLATQLLLNGKVEKDTKGMIGDTKHFGISSGFVFKAPEGQQSINMQYATGGTVEKAGQHCTDNGNDMRSMFSLELNPTNKFHRFMEEEEFNIKKSDKWNVLKEFQKKVQVDSDRYILVFYNFGVLSNGKFGVRVNMDDTPYPQSSFVMQTNREQYAFGMVVIEALAGEHSVQLEYISDLDFAVKPNEPGQSAQMSVISLPKLELENKQITETVTIDSKEWSRFSNELDISFKLKKRSKNVLIYYRVAFNNVDKVAVHFRVLVNDKEVPQGRTISSGYEVDTGVGQALIKLDKGSQKIVLQYKVDGKVEINANEYEGASITVVQFEVFKK